MRQNSVIGLCLCVIVLCLSCEAAPPCENGRRDGSESDVDCGGACGPSCATGQRCGSRLDCASGACSSGQCLAGSCSDTIRNGSESDVDCGGGSCPSCGEGGRCLVDGDCSGGPCVHGQCAGAPELSPQRGGVAGGTTLTLRGHPELPPIRAVLLDGVEASGLQLQPDGSVQVTTPPRSRSGAVDVVLQREDGRQETLKGAFRYYFTRVTFGSPIDIPSVGFRCSSLDTGDLNQDGKLDLVLGCFNANAYVYLGKGDGTFEQPTNVRFDSATELRLADVNNDGRPDVISAIYSTAATFNNIVISITEKDGTLMGNNYFKLKHPPTGFALVDLNQDKYLDIVVTHENYDSLTVMMNRGDGTFVDQDPTKELLVSSFFPISIAAADFDGNGKPDVVINDRNSNITPSVTVLYNSGSGSLSSSAVVPALGITIPVAATDWDDDGRPDIVASDTARVDFIRNRGGGFDPPVRVELGSLTPNRTRNARLADLNGDGVQDLILSSGQMADVAEIGIVVAPGRGRAQPAFGVAACSYGIAAAGDFTGDGLPDLVTACQSGTGPVVQLFANTSAE